MEVVSFCCPLVGRSVNEKEEFYELMDKVVTSKKLLVGGNGNGHVGSDIGGEVHGGFRTGQIYQGGIRLLNWVCWLIRFRSDETETMIDYILVNNRYRSSVKETLSIIDGYGVIKEGQEENSERN